MGIISLVAALWLLSMRVLGVKPQVVRTSKKRTRRVHASVAVLLQSFAEMSWTHLVQLTYSHFLLCWAQSIWEAGGFRCGRGP